MQCTLTALAARLPIAVAVAHRALYREDLWGTATAPVILRHKVNKPHPYPSTLERSNVDIIAGGRNA